VRRTNMRTGPRDFVLLIAAFASAWYLVASYGTQIIPLVCCVIALLHVSVRDDRGKRKRWRSYAALGGTGFALGKLIHVSLARPFYSWLLLLDAGVLGMILGLVVFMMRCGIERLRDTCGRRVQLSLPERCSSQSSASADGDSSAAGQ
jgi:hypothetical protein